MLRHEDLSSWPGAQGRDTWLCAAKDGQAPPEMRSPEVQQGFPEVTDPVQNCVFLCATCERTTSQLHTAPRITNPEKEPD